MIELPKRIAESIDRFTGRVWLLPKLLECWDHSDERLILLTGGPGTGKSMISAWLAGFGPLPPEGSARTSLERLRDAVKAAYFCRSTGLNTPRLFAESVANQLANKVGGYREALKTILEDRVQVVGNVEAGTAAANSTLIGVDVKLKLGAIGDEFGFDQAFIRPLRKLYANGHSEPMLLVVDALDEAQTYSGVTLPDLLSRFTDLPAPVRILATTRDDPRVLKLFRTVKPFDLIKDVDPDTDDVRIYVEERLTRLATIESPKRNNFAQRLATQANGVFLYAAIVLDDLLERPPVELPDLDTYPLPDGLSGLYHDFLTRELGKDEQRWFELYESLLGLIAVAQGEGLTTEQLADLVGKDIRAALRASKQYLAGKLPDGPFRPFHKSFSDFLLEDKENVDFHINAITMHGRIADYGWLRYSKAEPLNAYHLEHLPKHLWEFGKTIEQATFLKDLPLAVDRLAKGYAATLIRDYEALIRTETGGIVDPLVWEFLDVCRYALEPLSAANSHAGVSAVLNLAAGLLGRGKIRKWLAARPYEPDYKVAWESLRHTSPQQVIAVGAHRAIDLAEVSGTSVVAGGGGKGAELTVCNAFSGKRIWGLTAHLKEIEGDFAGGVNGVVLAKLGTRLVVVSCGADHKVAVRDAADGMLIVESGDLGANVEALAVAEANGQQTVIALLATRLLYLDLETLQRLGEPFELGSDVSFQELRRAGDTVLLAGVDKNGRARLWDAVARAELVRPIFLTEAGPVAAGIVDGLPILAVADEGHQIILSKDTSEPRRWAVPNRSEELITCLRIDTFEGRPVLLAGTYESSVFVWDLRTGKPAVQTLVGHSSTVVDVRVVNIAGVQSLVSTDLGGEVRRWFPGKADASEPVVPKYRAIALGKIQERDIVAAITNNCIELRDLRTGEILGEPLEWLGWPPKVARFVERRDDTLIMAVSWNAGISNRWTLDDYQRLPPQKFPINVNSVHVVRVENETFVVATGTDAGHSYWVVYDVDNERIAYPRREFPTGMVCCSVVDGQAMTFTVGGGEMRAWDMMSGSQLGETHSIEAQGRIIEQAELAKVEDELTLLFTTDDELWAVSAGTGKTIARRYVGTFPRLTIGMVHGQALVAVGNTNGRVRAWSLADWAIVATIEVGFPVSDVMLTDSGVLVCGDPGILSIWLRPRKGACSRGASGRRYCQLERGRPSR